MTGERNNLDAWFIHPKLALSLLSTESAQQVLNSLPHHTHPLWKHFHMSSMEKALAEAFSAIEPVSIAVSHLQGTLEVGQVAWAEQRFYYRGVRKATSEVEAGRPGRAEFHARLSTDDAVRLSGDFNVEHLTSSTSAHTLSGSGNQFVLGYVTGVSDTLIEIRPILIADRWGPGEVHPGVGFMETEPAHVWPSQVDQFAGVDWSMRLTKADLEELRIVPEQQVKEWLAEILGEPSLPKDWGGEQYDLWTDRITIDGTRVRAAFALKGPAKFHPMTVADLGKNGDQVSRLAQTVADLLVVQHCHSITAAVQHTLRAFAVDPANPRRYMTLDGYQTIRILRHFKFLGAK